MEEPKTEDGTVNGLNVKKEEGSSPHGHKLASRNSSRRRSSSRTPVETKNGTEGVSTPEATQGSKSLRKASQKAAKQEAPTFENYPDMTDDACATFQRIPDCLYGSKHMGSTDNDALDCDCREEWQNGENHSCDEDSDCINRATKMECVMGTGNCGDGCQNQRFQRKAYADVSVIKTEKKGFGLRANVDMQANDFIFEYIGEVINEPTFRRRMVQYDDEGIKHFYFMSLTKHEFVDATKKGNLGRFCNHSCNPNCYVDKWVVGDKLRMGIFTLRGIAAGEELVFNYNVDRYGADPQPCYCGEPNCTGYIGGKTQTERATKLPLATVEALGIDDGDSWDTAVAKKQRKKKPEEDDEDYVNSVQARGLDEEGARKVMASLMQCKEKWIAVKLLERIQRCDDKQVLNCVMRMHAYQILRTTLTTFIDDKNVVAQVLDILDKFPRLTRNKIQDSKIEATIETLAHSEDPVVAAESKRLLEEWSKLEVAYRIRRRKVDPKAPAAINSFEERRNIDREEDRSKPEPPVVLGADVPKGPRSTIPQRNQNFFQGNRPPRRHPAYFQQQQQGALPEGWFENTDKRGNVYFYTKNGDTTWQRPSKPAPDAPKAISKAKQEQQLLQSIIQQVTKETPKSSASRTPQQVDTPVQDPKKEKWRSLPIEKQMKIYENTLFPHVKYVLDKYRHKLPKEELKRLGKEVNKTLVSSDYRKNRVEDPTVAINHKKVKTIKQYVKDFLDRALIKFKERQSKKSEQTGQTLPASVLPTSDGTGVGESSAPTTSADIPMVDADDDVVLSDVDDVETASASSLERKRKREQLDTGSPDLTPAGSPSAKRVKDDDLDDQAPPPPPPPPPEAEEMEIGAGAEAVEQQPLTAEQLALREQEEALMRENEEAERLEAAERNSSANGAARLEEQRLVLNGHVPNGGVILSGDAAPNDGPPQGGA
ncbi:histone-lysine N-methyltransferase [Verticillium alfalfae VaMs.102]|uniref:Histone-lysine N-methyltransferase, H3 lysine-36 specific n=1 Tax=Verticillium alfalfae (strain VaMs.102 / ATCC MYA-4576 / FGSC 10136) TaxID=526221 RepID=C9SV17_VERA1|nr:histone-lysine N-methyltransferase [Verticillium alfalfae VaMs.102]EEY22632.1 histone-lysine N-methyltransferase [Verticillium alfalfae VaMs.102]